MGGEDTRSIPDLREGSLGASVRADEDLVVGERVGRYLVLSRIGVGGMGVVYAAYDPALDRQIAIKLLLSQVSASQADQDLLRGEARALARLQHGNVVSIYDVGEHDGRLFIAMELVSGQTLSAWLAAERRSWQEIVKVFIKAGRGLAAAHDEDLLHGDFKPSNVMISSDGSVRVMDFGLARFLGRSGSVEGDGRERARGLKGTPGFIAPEIAAGGVGDARSDLFSFCVALSHSLSGAKDVTREGRALRPRGRLDGLRSRAPGYVRRALQRGLAEDPDQRYSTMEELLRVLSPTRRRRRRMIGATLGFVALQGALWVPVWWRGVSVGQPCEVRSRFPEEVWGPERAMALQQRFVSVAPQGGHRMAVSVVDALDDYTETWAAARLDTCRAFEEKLESPRLYDLRMDCLGQRLSEVQAVVDVLLTADAKTVDRSLNLVLDIHGLARCSDRAELSNLNLPPFDPAKAGEVERLRGEIESALVALRTIDAVDLEGGKKLLERARALGHPLIEARALELVARQVWVRGDIAEAGRWMVDALTAALAAGDRPFQARLYARLAELEARAGADFARAETWERLADSVLLPLGEAHDEIRVDVERTLSHVDYDKGDLRGAEARLRRALAIGEEIWGPESVRLWYIVNDLGVTLGDSEERSDESIRLLKRALKIGTATLGVDSSHLLPARLTLSHRLLLRGDHEEAERLAYHALRIAEESRTFSRAPYPFAHLAQVLIARDRPGEALGLLETALAFAEDIFGEAHPIPIETRFTRGFAELQLLELSAARATFQTAVGLAEQLPADHWCARPPRLGLAYVELDSGREEAALEIFERLAAEAASDDSGLAPWVEVMLYGGLGEALLRVGRVEEARRYLERAIEEEPSHGDPLLLARPRFALARSVVDRDRGAALALATSAREGLSQARSPARLRLRSEVDAWLRAHRDEPEGAPAG